jgi:folate-binding protein YgfZ
MNPNWKNFLLSQLAQFSGDTTITFAPSLAHNDKVLCPVLHLGVLTVSGADAGRLLQGQISCDVHELTETKSSLGALCNPKGRVITTFLLIKKADVFLMILPNALLEVVKKRLQMYVLRSAVSITDSSEHYCLLGLSSSALATEAFLHTTQRQDLISIQFSATQNRQLVIAETEMAIASWSEQLEIGYQTENSEYWRYLDLLDGIPWLSDETSEEFIPQMLNLEQLGGISFTKGCYTGQEIVARTHYLGKAKRALFLAESELPKAPLPNDIIIDDTTDDAQPIGRVLQAQYSGARYQSEYDLCKLLLVLPVADEGIVHLKLKDAPEFPITINRSWL